MARYGTLVLGLILGTLFTVHSYSVEFPTPPELNFEYHNHDQLKRYLEDVAEAYPNLTTLHSIGKSVRDKELLVLVISAAPNEKLGVPNVKFLGNIHGNEPGGRELILHLIQFLVSDYPTNSTVQWLLNNTRIHMLPSVNPDGFEMSKYTKCKKEDNMGRKNYRRVDLNRNFPDYFRKNTIPSQHETNAIMKWLKEVPFLLSGSLHGGALVANYPFDNTPQDIGPPVTGAPVTESQTPDDDVFRHLATVYSSTHPTMHKGLPCPDDERKFKDGIVNGALWYPVTGGMQDYNYVWHGCYELTLEISCCKYPKTEDLPKLWQDNKEAMLKFAAQAHRGVQGLVLDYETNLTIPNATLWIDDRNINFTSSKFGEFWRILLPGNYTLKVSADNYRNYSIPFEVYSYEDDFESTMTWVNVTLISLNSTVSLQKLSNVLEPRNTVTKHPASPSTEVSSQSHENATLVPVMSSTVTLAVNGTAWEMQTHFMEQVSGSAQRSQLASCLLVVCLLHKWNF